MKIMKIREAIWNMFPNIFDFNVIRYSERGNDCSGEFVVRLMSGEYKELTAKYDSKTDEFEITQKTEVKK